MNTINYQKIEDYILSSCENQNLQIVYKNFISEYWYEQNKIRYQFNQKKAFAEYLRGLPSCFEIEYWNDQICFLLFDFGILNEKSTKRKIEKEVENWFDTISNSFFYLLNKK